MKTYFVNKIQNNEVSLTAESINDLEKQVIAYCDEHFGGVTKIYVYCSHVCSSTNTDEQNVEYVITVNNQKRIITTRRI